MTIIYLCISLAPLLSTGLSSKVVLHALTGECSGDCDICGCSAESRATGTCCCARKSKIEARAHKEGNLPDCCKKAPPAKGEATFSRGCPCGTGKSQLAASGKAGELIPFYFGASLEMPQGESRHLAEPAPLGSRCLEPPDPPPRQA